MSPKFAPPGRTTKERWPHEAAEASDLASTSSRVVLGGVLGVFLVPLSIRDWFVAIPWLIALVLGILIFLTIAVRNTSGVWSHRLATVWEIAAWILAAGALGVVIDVISLALCDDACRVALREGGRGSGGFGLQYLLLVSGSIGIAWLNGRLSKVLRRRTTVTATGR